VQARECIFRYEEWSDTVQRYQFECNHAVACRDCCEQWVARQGKPPYKCPLGTCDLKRNKKFRPVYLG
jgi:hypothetical protein